MGQLSHVHILDEHVDEFYRSKDNLFYHCEKSLSTVLSLNALASTIDIIPNFVVSQAFSSRVSNSTRRRSTFCYLSFPRARHNNGSYISSSKTISTLMIKEYGLSDLGF